jgi:hypothetical protein
VEFIKHTGTRFQVILENGFYFFVTSFLRGQAMAAKNPVSIRAYDKGRDGGGIEQNAIGSFKADAFHAEQFFSRFLCRHPSQGFDPPAALGP